MTTNINLPRGYLSYTQLIMWEKQPKKYKERYFYGEQTFTNKEMRFGKKVAEALETDKPSDNEMIQMAKILLPKFDTPEKKLTATLEIQGYKIPLLGYLDSWQKRTYNFREYKTGKTPWTQNKVNKHDQITFYALLAYLKIKRIPEKIFLDWLETENTDDGGIALTGNIKTFKTERTLTDLIRLMGRIRDAAIEISEEYQRVIKEIL